MMLSRSNTFSLLLSLLLLSSCSSYLSIEKRKYRDGFHIEQNLFEKERLVLTQRAQREYRVAQRNVYPVITAESEILLADNNDKKNLPAGRHGIFIETVSPGPSPIVFNTDTVKKKKKKHEGPKKFDDDKDVSKKQRKVPAIVQIGLILGIISFATLVWMVLGGVGAALFVSGVVSAIAGFAFCIAGLLNIKKNESKEGKELAIAGIILNSIYVVGIVLVLIGAIAYLFISLFQ